MARPLKTDEKKTARINGTRCTPAQKKQLEDMAHNAGFGRKGVWAMIWATFTGQKSKRRPTPRQEAIDRQFDTLKDIYEEAKLITDREEKYTILSAIDVVAKYFIMKRDDSKVQSPPKRPAADRVPDKPGGE